MTEHVHLRQAPVTGQLAAALAHRCGLSYGEIAHQDTTILVDGAVTVDAKMTPRLHTVIVPWAGIGEAALQRARDAKVQLFNLHHNAAATAEMALALLFSCARGIPQADARMRQGHWNRHDGRDDAIQLCGKSMCLFGAGEIGRSVGRVAESLGIEVIAIRRQRREDDRAHVCEASQLEEALARAHILVVAAPLTPETKGRISARELRLLKAPRVVVNVGRGPIIVERDLFELLRSREIHAAGLDVWYRYPSGDPPHFPSEFPFHQLDNVTLSPHTGGGTRESEPLREAALARLLDDLLEGRPVKPVDLELGY